MSHDTEKAAWRRELRTARTGLDPLQRAAETAAVMAALSAWLPVTAAVAGYVAVRGELDFNAWFATHWDAGRTIWLPSAGERDLRWHPVTAATQVALGRFSIPEPTTPAQPLPREAVILVPGIGFGGDGRRLGQGAGYYDRALADCANLTIGVGFACQRVDHLPVSAHDQACTAVLLGGVWVKGPPSAAQE